MKPGSLFSDRVFTWSILFTIKPEWSQKYYDEVLQFHSKKPAQLEEKEIKVSDHWLAELQKFDVFTSSKVSKKRSFNIMSKREVKPEVKPRELPEFKPSFSLSQLANQNVQVQRDPQNYPDAGQGGGVFRRGFDAVGRFGFKNNSQHYRMNQDINSHIEASKTSSILQKRFKANDGSQVRASNEVDKILESDLEDGSDAAKE